MLRKLEQFICELFDKHEYILRNRDGRFHVECIHCRDQSIGVVARLQR